MKRFILWAPAAALLALAACEHSPSGGDAGIASVQLMPDARVLAVGEAMKLEMVVRDDDGEEPTSRLDEVQFSSSNPGVAQVSAAGMVTGTGVGTATITAELEDVSGSIQVTVAAAPAPCSTPAAVRSLELGASVVLGGIQAAVICLDGGTTGREFVAVPFYADSLSAGTLQVRVGGTGVVPVLSASASVSPGLAPVRARARDEDWHQALRARAGRELQRHVDAALGTGARRDGLRPSAVINLQNPTVGQQVQVNTGIESCASPSMRTGRVAAVGTRSVVLADVANPAGGLTDAEYAHFAASFDTLVYPVVTQAFGVPEDVDQNGRVIIFYTSAVNALTPQGSNAYVGGFFHPRDLFPTSNGDGLSACAVSNYAEMFYMLTPDPSGTINGNAFPRDLVLETSIGTIAHEFQHLINASRRLYVLGTTNWNEKTWLNEALSHVSEELMFYHVSGLSPRQNLASADVQASNARLQAYRSYMDQNIRRYERYLEDPEAQSPYDADADDDNDLATRGAGWAFLRYAADRQAGADEALWKDLVDASVTGFANLQQALGTDPRPWVRDWTVSVFTDDVVTGVDPRYTQPSWRFRTFFSPWPLQTRNLAAGQQTLFLKSGSGAFIRFRVPPAVVAPITATIETGAPLPSAVYVTVVRTR
jgi:Bacterial Ig-like domain (group 2)